MAAQVDIYNMALGHLGVQQLVGSVTEKSATAIALGRFYENCRDTLLRAYSFPFSRKFKTLGLVEEDPTEEWLFSYRYPNDALQLRRILSGTRNDTEETQVPYLIGQDDQGLLLYCDQDTVQIEYTSKCENTGVFTPDFVRALSFYLASSAGPSIGKDEMKLADRAYKQYEIELGRAIVNSKAEEQPDRPPVDSFTRSRGY